jgi:hypothetical protein
MRDSRFAVAVLKQEGQGEWQWYGYLKLPRNRGAQLLEFGAPSFITRESAEGIMAHLTGQGYTCALVELIAYKGEDMAGHTYYPPGHPLHREGGELVA